MALTLQSPAKPGLVLDQIRSSVSHNTTELAFAVAYVTLSGCKLLIPNLVNNIGESWDTVQRTIVTCFDFGYTEPKALEYLEDNGFSIYIANVSSKRYPQGDSGALSFHPKFYIAGESSGLAAVITGSANLSRRALTVNFEAVSKSIEPYESWFPTWRYLSEHAISLTPDLLQMYESQRPKRNLRVRSAPFEPSVPSALPLDSVSTLEDAVEHGAIDPIDCSGFWVEVGYASGGSQSQIELPRLACRFFGFNFANYQDHQDTIGNVDIHVGSSHILNRPISWHGDNRMERINVPTQNMGGPPVMNRVVFFQRHADYFEMTACDHGSSDHEIWRDSSAATGMLFKLGKSDRWCGLI